MASKAGQGILITLILFVVLFLAAAVSAVLIGQSMNEAYTQLQTAKKKAEDAARERQIATDNVDTLTRKIGAAANAPIGDANDANAAAPAGAVVASGTIVAQANSQLARAKNLLGDPAVETFDAAVTKYDAEVARLRTQLQQKIDESKRRRDEFERLQSVKDGEMKAHVASRDDAEAKRIDAETRFRTELDNMSKNVEASRSEANKAATERQIWIARHSALQKKFDVETNALESQLVRFQRIYSQTSIVDRPDGEVLRANIPQRFVHLNIGEADGLRPQETFSVWAKNVPIAEPGQEPTKAAERSAAPSEKVSEPYAKAGPKAGIEVLRVTGPHTSLARIVYDVNQDPIVPGDRIYSPLWTAGKRERFCLAGVFDISGKKQDDRELLRVIILRRGGVIDCELKATGELIGEVSPSTDWYVIGGTPTGDTTAYDAASTTLQRRAEQLGVQIMTQDELYAYLGYNPVSRLNGTQPSTAPPAPTDAPPAAAEAPAAPTAPEAPTATPKAMP